MTSRLNPLISFGDTAPQAMESYRDVFGGNLAISTFAEFGQADSPDANKVMHAQSGWSAYSPICGPTDSFRPAGGSPFTASA